MFTISEDDSDYLIISLSMLTLQTRAINYIASGALELRVQHKHSYLGRVASSQCGQQEYPNRLVLITHCGKCDRWIIGDRIMKII